MAYFCFCDYESTLTGENNEMSSTSIDKLKIFLKSNKLCIISYASYFDLKDLNDENTLGIDFYSMSHSCGMIDNQVLSHPLDTSYFDQLLSKYDSIIYTAYMTNLNNVYIYKYQERLEFLYPKGTRNIIHALNSEILNITIAVNKPNTDLFYTDLKNNNISYTILASDLKRDIIFIAKPATKKEIVQNLIHSHAGYTTIGIGDSYSDYEFIALCDVQIAMQNSDMKLKELCRYTTKLDNTKDGCINSLLELDNS